MNNDFSFNWDNADFFAPNSSSVEESVVHNDYTKRDSFNIKGFTVHNLTESSMGRVEASNCTLNKVCGREGVILNQCSASNVSSSMENVVWNGWNGEQKNFPNIEGREGVHISNLSTENVISSMGMVILNNASAKSVKGKNDVRLKDAEVNNAEVTMGKLFSKESKVKFIAARNGVELINSKVDRVVSSLGTFKAVNSKITDVEVKCNVTIKNCSGDQIKSIMGELIAISEKLGADRFNLLEARDGLNLTNISSEKVRSLMGAVDCVGGSFDLVELSKTSTLKQANIKHLEINVSKNDMLIINLTDSVVTSVAIKVTERFSGSSIDSSSMSIPGAQINLYVDGSSLSANSNNFLVQGSLTKKFKGEITRICKVGTIGSVNGVPAIVTSSGIQIQKESLSENSEKSKKRKTKCKVTFIGGKIIGNITHEAQVKVDSSKTTFEGEIISE